MSDRIVMIGIESQDLLIPSNGLASQASPIQPAQSDLAGGSKGEGWGASFDVTQLDGSNGFRIDGVRDSDRISTVASAGDFNGDGLDDVLIGAGAADAHGRDSGEAYLMFGQSDGFDATFRLSSLDGSNGFAIAGLQAGDVLGSVACAGDVNGDGLDDIILGASGVSTDEYKSGASYVIFGTEAAQSKSFDLSSLDGSNGFRVDGVAERDRSGISVQSAGDINGDGFSDIVIGAKYADLPAYNAGAAYVVFGKADGFGASIDLGSLDGSNGFRMQGLGTWQYAGWSVSGAGDINGDGIDDLMVAAKAADAPANGSGAVYVVFGATTGFSADISPTDLDGANGFVIGGAGVLDYAGWSMGRAGDVNGDGLDDIIVGAPSADANGKDSGAAYVIFGSTDGFGAALNLGAIDGSNGFRIVGGSDTAYIATAVAGAGDINGDGFDDIVVGAAGLTTVDGFFSGAAYVVFGRASGLPATLNVADLDGVNGFVIDGQGNSQGMGVSVSAAGDLNGDGFDDLIVSAPGASSKVHYSGSSYVIYGTAPDAPVTRVGSEVGQVIHGGGFDDSLSGLGGEDTLIGADGDDTLAGGAGNDTLDGGAGADAASFTDATEGVSVTATQAALAEATGQGTDTLISIENLIGSAFNDLLSGDELANVIEGGEGDDSLTGGEGLDTASYGHAASAVHVDLSRQGLAQPTGAAGSDVLSGFENLLGSAFGDALSGDGAANRLAGAGGDDQLEGGEGADTLDGGDGTDTASFAKAGQAVTVSLRFSSGQETGAGADTLISIENLTGSRFGDSLTGDGGDNVLNGGLGDDVLQGGDGDDRLIGGAGVDLASYASSSVGVAVDLSMARGQVTGAGRDVLSGIEGLTGSRFADALSGNGGDNLLYGGGGADILSGALGDDTLDGGAGADTASYADAVGAVTIDLAQAGAQETGAAGLDVLKAVENLLGSSFGDLLSGNDAKNLIDGAAGDDSLLGAGGADTLKGGLGDDSLDGGAGDDAASYADASAGVAVSLAISGAQETGVAGRDVLAGIEQLVGSGFGDTLGGAAAGDFTLTGGDGDDLLILVGGGAKTLLDGGAGIDTADWSGAAGEGWSFDLGKHSIRNLDGAQGRMLGVENLVGSEQSDRMIGDGADNSLSGGSGDDTISGADGDDVLAGGAGSDRLAGGKGVDLFEFGPADAGTGDRDIINDFKHGDDLIDLTGFGMDLSFVEQFDGGAGEVVISNTAGGNLVQIDLDGDKAPDVAIFVRVAHHALDHGDFIL